MRKSLALILLAASTLGVGGGSTLCLAAEDVNQKAATSPEAAPPQPSQRKMHQLSQRKKHQLSQRKMHRMQKAGSSKPPQGGSAAEPVQVKPEEAPNLSQRSMRQKLKETKPKAPAAGNPEAR